MHTNDFASDAPLSYDDLAAAHREGRLLALLAAMTPRQRVGSAALIAERRGLSVGEVLRRFARAQAEAEAT